MKKWKKIISLFIVLAIFLSIFKGPIVATSIGTNSFKANCEDDTLTFQQNSVFDLRGNQRLEKVVEIVYKITLDELISAVEALNEAKHPGQTYKPH